MKIRSATGASPLQDWQSPGLQALLKDLLCALWMDAAAARSNRLQTAVPQAQKLQC